MIKYLFFLLLFFFKIPAVQAASPLQEGMNAFSVGDYETAEKILRPIEKTQPSAAYLLRRIEVLNKSAVAQKNSKEIFLRDLRKGNMDMLDKLGMVSRISGQISGISGAMGLRDMAMNAQKGNAAAAYKLALFNQEGIGLPQSFKKAANLFEIAANGGNAAAMNSLGVYYRYGIGVEKNGAKAKEYFNKAIEKNNAYAFYNLADMMDEGDGISKDILQSHLLADIAILKMNKETDKKRIALAQYLKKKNLKNFTPLQEAYLKKFLPYSLSHVLPKGYLNGRTYPKKLPLPPANGKMIDSTYFMRPLNTDPQVNKYKTIPPFLPNWVPFNSQSPIDPRLETKKLIAPAADSSTLISALYYRPADARHIEMTLSTESMALPVMVGDILTLYAYSTLHETEMTKKGAHKKQENTEYMIKYESDPGVMTTNTDVLFRPLSKKTKDEEAWIGMRFAFKRPGKALIRFIPREEEESNKAFSYTILLVASEGEKPK